MKKNRSMVSKSSFLHSAILWFGCLVAASLAQADNVNGAWSTLEDWPLIAIHAAVTPDGRVLSYGTKSDGQQTGYFIYDIWDPAAGLGGGHMTLNNMTLTDIFCSSQIILPQSGEILIAGGDNWTGNGTTNTGNNNSNLFSYADNTLAQSMNMNRARWYSSSTALVNGEIYIQGGSGGADLPEVRQTDGNFRLLTNAPTGSFATLFPRNFLAPDGRVFGYDTNGKMYFVATDGLGSLTPAGQFASSNAGWTSGAAMFQPGKILQIGGNSNGAVVVDINGPAPSVTATSSMSSQRRWVSATVLADGRVLGTGGSEVENQLVGVNNAAEIWDPATGQWHLGPAGDKARLYHSSALLLPDATVLVAGGGAPGPLNNTNAEIYYPPYLFDGNGGLADRPEILSAPDTANVGDNLAIQIDASTISRVTIVKTGSVTHSVNMDQRFIELPFDQSSNMLSVSLPVRASDTPPGFYMLFAFDNNGVPSEATMLRVNIDPTPNVAVDYTPAIGGGGGGPFQLACEADEVLVGVHGRYATYVNQVGPQCVAMDQLGRWIGDPVDRPVTGNTTSGTPFSKTCQRDSAMSGFRGRSGQYVNQIEIECRALTGDGGLSGDGEFLGGTGGNGGTQQALLRCGTGNPVYALYGRSGGWLDNFGVQCRRGVVTQVSVNSMPVIANPGAQSGVVGEPAGLQLSASDGDGDVLTFGATGLPPGLTVNTVSGWISGTPTAEGNYTVEVTVSDGADVDSESFTWSIAAALPLNVAPMPAQAPVERGTIASYTASVSGGVNPVFNWNFGDGTPETGFSSSPTIEHTFEEPGIYYVALTVNDDVGVPSIQTFVQAVHLPLTATRPNRSGNILYENRQGTPSRVWVVNQDNDSVSVFDAASNTSVAEIGVGTAPRSIALAPDGRIWVTNKTAASISIIDPDALTVAQTLAMPSASQPYGLVFSPAGGEAFVVLQAMGQVLKLDAATGAQVATVTLPSSARHLAVDASGSSLYVSRFITGRQPGEDAAVVETQVNGVNTGGEIFKVATASMVVVDTIVLQHSEDADAENQGRGVPNYLGAMAIAPDGVSARVPSKKDNIARGTLRSGGNLNFQNTVRAISSRIDMGTGAEDHPYRIDHDNASIATDIAYDAFGIYAFVALETSRELAVVDVHDNTELFRIDVGRAPQGVAVSPDGSRLYVNNFMDRTVSVLDLSDLQTTGAWNVTTVAEMQAVANEALAADVLLGKQLFYDARDTRLAFDRYLSCAVCHNDGGGDGRIWDLTGMGEGLRNTISLTGRSGAQGPLHWSENFDEVQDFEGQIRTLSAGTGLMSNADFAVGTRSEPLGDPKAGISADLDALAAYVESLTTFAVSPHRNDDGSLTTAAVAGRQVFQDAGCDSCHSEPDFTDSAPANLHDIGTIKPTSGMRLGGPLDGIDTPTLRGVWSTAPYLHDGSAATLAEAVLAHDGVDLSGSELSQLVSYLQQIDALEGTGAAGLIGYWPMNEGAGPTTADASGNGNTGTLVNGTLWGGGPGLTFDGINDYVDVGTFDVPGNELTLAAMVRSDQLDNCPTYNDCRVISKATSTSSSNHYFMLSTWKSGGETRLRFRLKVNGTTQTLIASSGALVVGEWAHVAATYDGAQMRVYLDGVEVGSRAVSGDISVNASVPVWIGSNPLYASQVPWKGRIDEVRVYSRALTEQELLSLAGGNAPPQANDGTINTAEDTPQATVLSASDADGDPLTYSVVSGPANGSISGSGANVTYTPDADFFGNDSFEFQVSDDLGGVDTASVSVTVTPVNDAPSATPDSHSMVEGNALNVSVPGVLGNDLDVDGDAMTAVLEGIASNGSLTLNADGSFSYAPNAGFVGTDSFTYRASDGQADSAPVAVLLTVEPYVPPNTPPVASDQAVDVNEDSTVPLVLTANDADGDALSYSVVTGPSNGSLSGSAPNLSYTPDANYFGGDTITFLANDGEDDSNIATVSLNVVAVNDLPVAVDDAVLTEENVAVGVQLQASDVDGDTLEYIVTGNPANGSISGTPPSLTYTPDPGFTGDDSIGFGVSDGNGGEASGTVTVTVTPPAAGLVAYWPMNEGAGNTIMDASGNGHTGTLVNGTQWGPGPGLAFDGYDDYVDVGSFDVTGSELTISAWVRSDQLDNCAPYNDCRILSKSTSTSSQAHYFMLSTWKSYGQTRLRFRLKTNGITSTLIANAGGLVVDQWMHAAATYDGAFMRLYLDGVEVGAKAVSGDISTNSNVPVWIGASPTRFDTSSLGRPDRRSPDLREGADGAGGVRCGCRWPLTSCPGSMRNRIASY